MKTEKDVRAVLTKIAVDDTRDALGDGHVAIQEAVWILSGAYDEQDYQRELQCIEQALARAAQVLETHKLTSTRRFTRFGAEKWLARNCIVKRADSVLVLGEAGYIATGEAQCWYALRKR